MNLSHAQQEKRLADRRRKEIAREDDLKRINQEKILEANVGSEERIENKRFLRIANQKAMEIEMDEAVKKVITRILRHTGMHHNVYVFMYWYFDWLHNHVFTKPRLLKTRCCYVCLLGG